MSNSRQERQNQAEVNCLGETQNIQYSGTREKCHLPGSEVALATAVGVLVEVTVMLSVCRVCNCSRGWCQTKVPGLKAAN